MQLQLSRLILSLGALTFVAANANRFSNLRSVLEYEYRPRYWFSHLKYVDSFGNGAIDDWDSLVITYIDEEYRDFLKKEMDSETVKISSMTYLLLREAKVGDTIGKIMGGHDEYEKIREGRPIDAYQEFVMNRTPGKLRKIALRCIFAILEPIFKIIQWGIGVSRNAGVIYEGAIYTISLNGHVWRVVTLPTNFNKDYDPTTALDLTERINQEIDVKMPMLDVRVKGWVNYCDGSGNRQHRIEFQTEEDLHPFLFSH